MKTNTSTNSQKKQRSTSLLSDNESRVVQLKRSDSDVSLLSMADPIDTYREHLKAQGCVEIDIPEALQKQIDTVNKVLESHQEHHYIDNTDTAIESYISRNHAFLNDKDKKSITVLSDNFKLFIQKKLSGIFNDKCVIETQNVDLLIRCNDEANNILHKDHRFIDTINNITVIYPMLDQKGTAYIPYDKKNAYLESDTNNKDIDDAYTHGHAIDTSGIKYADNKKIFALLCRRASKDLGRDYDAKSLVHAIPEPDDATKARIFILGRFAVENKKPIQPS
jgi:hypothetical protein